MSKKRRQEDEDTKNEKKIANHWSMGLLSSMKEPELLVKEDDKVAQYHFLVLPKENISSLAKITKDDIELLKHMDKVGQELAESHPNSNFKLGYHAEASMSRLHLHVISDDFNSTCLKTRKHWNTFTTDFFVPSVKKVVWKKVVKTFLHPSHLSLIMYEIHLIIKIQPSMRHDHTRTSVLTHGLGSSFQWQRFPFLAVPELFLASAAAALN
ncbi:aprataxin isoform X2 [Cryptotermes secundus]|uniref:aprataxin isoform X2 n=1 Tax=Cryptotermes secundus TaxID=105785 RepID=UPI000CD7AC28|nr:aprataxin isoform X2 [Cryptotermes secundus]